MHIFRLRFVTLSFIYEQITAFRCPYSAQKVAQSKNRLIIFGAHPDSLRVVSVAYIMLGIFFSVFRQRSPPSLDDLLGHSLASFLTPALSKVTLN